jgi:hypothetical protein
MPWSWLIPAAASLIGGYTSSRGQQQAASTQANASTQAASIQAAAAQKALDLQEKLANEQVLRNAPYSEAGITAQNRMLDLMGLSTRTGAAGFGSANQPYSMAGFDPNSLMRNFGASDFQIDPGYSFRLSEGLKALDRQAAARGGVISGAALKAAGRYGQEAASQEYGNAFNRFQTNRASQAGLFTDAYNRDRTRQLDEFSRLGGLMTSGQNAAAGTGASQAAFGSNAANLMSQGAQAMGQGVIGAGQATAAGQMGAGNTYNNAIQAALQGYQNNQMMDVFRNRQSAYSPQQIAYANRMNVPQYGQSLFDES